MQSYFSASYEPEYGTYETAKALVTAIANQKERISKMLGDKELPIIDIANDNFEGSLPIGSVKKLSFTERELRIIHFALNRAIETL
jgi:hypothetical protein